MVLLLMSLYLGCDQDQGDQVRYEHLENALSELKEESKVITRQLAEIQRALVPSQSNAQEIRSTVSSSSGDIASALAPLEAQLRALNTAVSKLSDGAEANVQAELREAAKGRDTDWEAVGKVADSFLRDKTSHGLLLLGMKDIVMKLGKPTTVDCIEVSGNRVAWWYDNQQLPKALVITFIGGTVDAADYQDRRQ